MDVVGQYRDAGFSDEEIADHMGALRSRYQAAGFSDAEIDAHLGIPATPDAVPPALLHRGVAGNEAVKTLNELPSDGAGVSGWLDRLWQRGAPRSALEKGVEETSTEPANAFLESAKAAGRGFLIGFGDKPIGSWTGPPDWNQPGWKKGAQAGLTLLGLPFEAAIRTGGGIAGAVAGAGMEAGKQATGAEYSPEDVAGFLNDYLPGLIGVHAPLARLERDPTGTPQLRTIGGLPKGQDFLDASTAIGNGDAMPPVEDKLATLYRERGVHPAEVAHDAQTDPTVAQAMLSSDKGELPGAYGADTSVRLYRGQRDWGPYPNEDYRPRAQFWTTNPERARDYGDVRYIDVTPETLDRDFSRDFKGDYQTGDADSVYHSQARPIEDILTERLPSDAGAAGRAMLSSDKGQMPEAYGFDNERNASTARQLPRKPDAIVDPIIDRVRSFGTPMDVALQWAKDPEKTYDDISDLITGIKSAEKEIKRRYSAKTFDDLEDAPLSRAETDFLFYGKEHTDADFWRDLRSQLQPVENLDEAASEIAHEFKRLPTDTSNLSSGDEIVLTRLQVLFSEVGRLGGNLNTVLGDAAKKYGAKFGDPEDGVFMVENAAERLRGLMGQNQAETEASRLPPAAPRALPAPQEDILTERLPSSAGAAGRAMPSYSDAEKQILSKISVDEKAPERALTWDGLYTGFIDKLFPIAKAVKEADLPDLTPENNPYQLARLMAGYAGKADHFLNNGTFDFASYENNGPSLKTILQPVAKDLNGFRAYAAAARAIELEDRGIKSGFDFPEGPSAPPLVSTGLDAARTVVAGGRDKFEAPFRALVDYQNRVAGYLRDSGVLSEAGHAAMVEANKMYVPFTRVMGLDEAAPAQGGSSLQARNPIKAIKGSARDIVDPIESVARNTYHMIEMAERNTVGTKLVDMLRGAGEIAPDAKPALEAAKAPADPARTGAISEALGEVGIKKPDELAAALASATEPEKPGTISILRDGKRETYNVDPELARAMKGLDAQSMSMLERMLAFPAKTLRAGAVLTPEFWGRHVLRDFLYAATTFKEGVFHPGDMARGFLGLIMKDEDYWNWLKGGGGNIASAGIDRRYLQEDLRELTAKTGLLGRAWNVLADPEAAMWDKAGAVGKLPFQAIGKFVLDPLRAGTQFAENASHLAAFKKSMRASDRREPDATNLRDRIIRAAWTSRDTAVDAARMGANMRAYNLITAFANIKLQDTDRVVRAIRDNPIPTLLKIAGAITAPSVALWAANHNDPRYQEIPQWQKDMFWLVMTPDHVFRIPKPWAMGMTFGTIPERLLDAYVGEKPDAFKNFFTQFWKQVGPDFVPTAAAPIIDQFANRSTFTNRTLIPSAQEKFLPEYQYTPYTTELTKSLGRIIGAFPGIRDAKMDESGFGGAARAITSPILMENYIREWTGNLGSYALDAADTALRKQGILPDPPMPTKTLADIPMVRAFVVRYPSASAESIQDFYDAYARNKSYFDTFMAKARDGDVQATQHIVDMGGPMMFLRLDGIQQALNEHSKLIADIYKNPQIQPDEKRQLIDQAYYRMIEIAQAGNQAIRQMQQSVTQKNLLPAQ